MGNHIKLENLTRAFCKAMLFSFFGVALVSCSKNNGAGAEVEPEVTLPYASYEIVKGDDPFTFEFKNLSKNYSRVEWRFGDDIVSKEVSPVHVFMNAGDYQVDLKAFSESGGSARKMLDLRIVPDSIFSVTAVPTNVAGEVKFKITSKVDIASASWAFSDDKTTSTSLDPVKKFTTGKVSPFTIKIKTAKGSEAQLTRQGSVVGVVTNITSAISEMKSSHENAAGKNSNEGTSKIIDNSVDTKWYMSTITFPVWNQFTFETPQIIRVYGIGSGNDVPNRDPRIWTFQGSNDGVTWEILDSRTMTANFYTQAGLKYKQLFYYEVPNPKPFLHYKFHVTANFGETRHQISEFMLFK